MRCPETSASTASRSCASFKELNVTPADVGSWQGLLTTAGTPAPVQQRLNAELNKILAMPDIAKRIESLGGEVKAGPSADLAKWIETNTASYAAIIKEAGIKVQ